VAAARRSRSHHETVAERGGLTGSQHQFILGDDRPAIAGLEQPMDRRLPLALTEIQQTPAE
jgi:hypothetical protein